MSDTENKTDVTTEEKTIDTAPYLTKKKPEDASHSGSSRGNFVIPLILLLVSAIVITATFYEDEYKNLLAGNEVASNEPEADVETTVEATNEDTVATAIDESSTEEASVTAAKEEQTTAEVAVEPAENTTAATIETQAIETATSAKSEAVVTEETEKSVTVTTEAKEASGTVATATVTEEKVAAGKVAVEANTTEPQTIKVAVAQTSAPSNAVSAKPAAYTPNQANPKNNRLTYQQARQQAYEQNVARAKAQAKKNDEIIRQRRQAYEAQMAARRQHYEATMKAREEKRTEMANARKAVFQRAQEGRMETNQKIIDAHKKIDELHNEIHQLMNEARASYKAPVTSSQSSTAEKI